MPCTVVNLLPFDLHEKKIGLVPPTFDVPARFGDLMTGIPGVLVIDNVTASTYIDESRGSLVIRKMPDEIAESVVKDFMSAQVFYNENACPGLFWVDGKFTGEQILKQFKDLVDNYRERQIAWYKILAEQAEVEYNRYHSSRAIYEAQRVAARELNLEVAWMKIERADATMRCPGCQSLVSVAAAICPSCKVVLNQEAYKKLQIAGSAVTASSK